MGVELSIKGTGNAEQNIILWQVSQQCTVEVFISVKTFSKVLEVLA